MKSKLMYAFLAMIVLVSVQSIAQTQESRIIYKFPIKGSADAKTKTLKTVDGMDNKHNFLIFTKMSFTIVLKNGKQYVFQKIDKPQGKIVEDQNIDFWIPKTTSNDPDEDKMSVQIFKKWIVLTDTDQTKQFFKLTNADSFDEADALF